jgi:GT2 family glycosyltransferase
MVLTELERRGADAQTYDPAMSASRVSVVIVNYEGRGRLGRTVQAVLAQTGVVVEIIVVDNASTDESWREAEGSEHVTIVRNSENVGFGRACNQGAAQATGEYLVFLNPDCRPAPEWASNLVDAAESESSVGAVQALILYEGREGVNTSGNRAHYLGFSWMPLGIEPVSDEPYEIATGCGASLLVLRERFEAVGGFWDELFLYHEDFDLCWRLRLRGWRILLAPKAIAFHEYEFSRNPDKYFHMERGRLLVITSNYAAGTLLRLAPGLLAAEIALLAVALHDGWLVQKVRASLSFVAATPALKRHRRAVQASRVVRDEAILALFETSVGGEFGETASALTAYPLALYARATGMRARGAAGAVSRDAAAARGSEPDGLGYRGD